VTQPPDDVRATWRRISDLFDRALQVAPDARHAFVDQQAADDPLIATEVKSLLDAHGRSDGFIDLPAAPRAELDALARLTPIVGTPVGPYRLLRVLGEGGMGVVYLAHDTRLDRQVALKALPPRFAGDAQRAARLRQEARTAASLVHPGVATIYALEEIDGQIYIAAEYVPGRTLREELAGDPLPPPDVLSIAIAIADALSAAHRAGIVHRDLKPENVMRTPDGQIKILDFGIARLGEGAPGAAALTAGQMPGTPAYMSPEQVRSGLVDQRSDLFALGVLIVELLTGTNPFMADNHATTIARILEHEPALGRFAATTGATASERTAAGLAEIARVLLRKFPDARYQSAAEVIDALKRMEADRPVTARSGHARAWWVFHEVAATITYSILLVPLWRAREFASRDWGILLFLAGLVAVIVAGALRLHLCFAARHYPAEWPLQHSQSTLWIRSADIVFAAALMTVGLLAVRATAASGVLLVAGATAVLVSALIIEPATTRAGWGRA
jgi:serine/threonine protein kinase